MHEYERSISRIIKMEQLFDFLRGTLRSAPAALSAPSARKAVQTLSDYYTSGDWLHDYELDEQRLLPPGLRRGVLSQDGLYDLLTEIKKISAPS